MCPCNITCTVCRSEYDSGDVSILALLEAISGSESHGPVGHAVVHHRHPIVSRALRTAVVSRPGHHIEPGPPHTLIQDQAEASHLSLEPPIVPSGGPGVRVPVSRLGQWRHGKLARDRSERIFNAEQNRCIVVSVVFFLNIVLLGPSKGPPQLQ